jgi:hypothetical protein
MVEEVSLEKLQVEAKAMQFMHSRGRRVPDNRSEAAGLSLFLGR